MLRPRYHELQDRHGPVCKNCWAETDDDEREDAKAEFNKIAVGNADQLFCKIRGCWEVVRIKDEAKGFCHKQMKNGECSDIQLSEIDKHPRKRPRIQLESVLSAPAGRGRAVPSTPAAVPSTPAVSSKAAIPSTPAATSMALTSSSDVMLEKIDTAIRVGHDIISEVQKFQDRMTILRSQLVSNTSWHVS